MNEIRKLLAVSLTLLALAGCASTGPEVELSDETTVPLTSTVTTTSRATTKATATKKTTTATKATTTAKATATTTTTTAATTTTSVATAKATTTAKLTTSAKVTTSAATTSSTAATTTATTALTTTAATAASTTTATTTAKEPVYFEYMVTEASGTAEKRSDQAVIDYSNAADGYVMVNHIAGTDKRLKVQVKGPKSTYSYDLPAKKWQVFPLSEGNGNYKVSVYVNITGTKYATVLSVSFDVTLESEYETFLYPNQYVDFSAAPNTIKKAQELCGEITEPLEKVAAVYDYVVDTLTYDKQKAKTVKSGYLPVLDDVLKVKTGICFDYAALMTGMLRSQGIPCQLVVGYAGTAYHAWINVWTEETGWINSVIFFDGTSWQRMDPTFASSSKRSDSIMEYIGDNKNYKEKYLY